MDATNSETPLAFSASAAQNNHRIVSYCRTSLAALAGVTAGILGLTGIIGFIFYFACSMFLSLLFFQKTGREWKRYFLSKYTVFTSLIFGETLTYILCWTFIYGMVHVY
ncbi:unnamed protein product [Hymenolepis diminuta]|uniref:ER membrane protein complex subunit 6 n=1 Tax=Hymenolepis diminuta TaxID=6216 RepID=A0A564YG37_HYMDI|nr:unnamed protein product [Hymenolepis diminuta]